MGIMSRLFHKSNSRESGVSAMVLSGLFADGEALTSPHGQAKAGYLNNPYVRRASDLYGAFTARPDTLIFGTDGQQIVRDDHPLMKLLDRPNPSMDRNELMIEIGTNLGIYGEAFVFPLKTASGVRKLFVISPQSVMAEETGDPLDPIKCWRVSRGTAGIMTLEPQDLIHIKLHNPDPASVRGCSPIVSAKKSVEMQNAIRDWNIAMTKNGAKGSVIIEVPRALTDAQFEGMTKQLQSYYGGTTNAGKGMILDDGKKATSLGMTSVEMDYVQGTAISAREVSIAYGIAPEVLGDSQNKTYANMSESYRQTVQTTVIPLLKLIYGALSAYLLPFYPDVSRMTYDIEQVNDLMGDQTEVYTALEQSSFLTINEKREKLGYEPHVSSMADSLLVNMGVMPIDEIEDVSAPQDGDADGVL